MWCHHHQSTVLDRDIGPCSGPGLVVRGSNITLDLNRHSVVGDATKTGEGLGIVLARTTGVVVRGGTVKHFDAGVVIRGGSDNTVSNIEVEDNVGPNSPTTQEFIDRCLGSNAQPLKVDECSAGLRVVTGEYGDGIAVQSSARNLIANNVVQRNGQYDGIGVFGAGASGNRITKNLVEANAVPTVFRREGAATVGTVIFFDSGISLVDGAGGNTVDSNHVEGNGADGIFVATPNNVITGNRTEDNGKLKAQPIGAQVQNAGIKLVGGRAGGRETHVEGNTALDNRNWGIETSFSEGNQILNNIAYQNGSSATARVEPGAIEPAVDPHAADLFDFSAKGQCEGNIWRGNRYGTVDPPCAGG